ncbi:MAG: hypothetical protein ABW068_02260 [Candidatus Thiodiazotropha sp.]
MAALMLLGLCLSGCSGDPETPENRLRATLEAAEQALQQRDLGAVMGFVHPEYRSNDGQDYRLLRAQLMGYLLRHKSIHILYRIEHMEIRPETGDATVRLYAGVAGGAQQSIDSFDQWHGDLLYLELGFRDEASEGWLLTHARWEPVRAESI